LDNVEQIADAGLLCAELLAWAPDLKILVTSRIALRVSGEHELQVAPLTVPDERSPVPAVLAENASAALFRVRARALSPSFEITTDNAPAVAEICRRLEGIPLAGPPDRARLGEILQEYGAEIV
jgi:predicted ATPase